MKKQGFWRENSNLVEASVVAKKVMKKQGIWRENSNLVEASVVAKKS